MMMNEVNNLAGLVSFIKAMCTAQKIEERCNWKPRDWQKELDQAVPDWQQFPLLLFFHRNQLDIKMMFVQSTKGGIIAK